MKLPQAYARGALLLCALLAGCSGFRSSAQPEQTYYLRAPYAGAGASRAAGEGSAATSSAAMPVSLRVGHPFADPGLESPHIMLVQADHRMNFYAGRCWPAPAADLIETLAVQTLSASGQWATVMDSRSPFPSNYLLQLAVRRFDADYSGGGAAPEVHVVIDCIIGRREGRDVVATFVAAGAAGFVDKYNDDFEVLMQAVDEIGRNGRIVTGSLHNALRKLARKCRDVRLSDTLEETLVLLEQGMKDVEIAKIRCLSAKTIEDHKRKILAEFGNDLEGQVAGFANLTRELGIAPGDIVNDRAGHRPRRGLIARAMPWRRSQHD